MSLCASRTSASPSFMPARCTSENLFFFLQAFSFPLFDAAARAGAGVGAEQRKKKKKRGRGLTKCQRIAPSHAVRRAPRWKNHECRRSRRCVLPPDACRVAEQAVDLLCGRDVDSMDEHARAFLVLSRGGGGGSSERVDSGAVAVARVGQCYSTVHTVGGRTDALRGEVACGRRRCWDSLGVY